MKILLKEKWSEENVRVAYGRNLTLPKRATAEEAKKNRLPVYVNEEWRYVIGREIVDFIFLEVRSQMLYGVDGEIKHVLYELELWTNEERIKVEISQEEYYQEKWLKQIRTRTLLLISKNNYHKLIKIL